MTALTTPTRLNLKKDEDKAPQTSAVTTTAEAKRPTEVARNPLTALWNQPKVRPRPKLARGMTIKKDSPLGKIYVTINNDDEGEPPSRRLWSDGEG